VAEALYRKWRPRTFDDVVGQDHVSTTLRNQIATGRVGHAYLFVGSRGCGKTTSARILAREVNIVGLDPKDAERIGDSIAEGRALDVIEIDAASHTGVDAIREIIDKVNFHPGELRYKVYIIDEVHMLSTAAFNALLKTLEEPPAHVIFILATTDPQKIPPTVLSRCQRFTFKRVPVDKIVGRLRYICEKEGFDADDHALKLIARQATGALRDAVSLLDQLASSNSLRISANDVRESLGATDSVTVKALTEGIAARNLAAGFDAIQAAVDQGADARQIARQMVDHLRALMQLKVSHGAASGTEMSEAERIESNTQAERLSMAALSRAIKAFSTAINEMRQSTDAQLPLEMAYLDCVAVEDTAQAAAAERVVERVVERPVERAAATAGQNTSHVMPQAQSAMQAPPATTAVAAAPAESGGNANDKLLAGWKDFVRDMRKTNPALAALLNTCRPQNVQGNIVYLRADHDFARQKLDDSQTSGRLKQLLSQWLGIKAELNVFVNQVQQLDPNDDPVVKAAKRLGGQVRQ
jgi:DNA polymerase III subunit gamma/tau